ncbi:MAG: ABC transporter ATP-binding protein [Marinomonas hwangdonensis]|nr:ABC transporter ATP-binding protein [Marinomonas hwangdonensis]
MIKETPFASLNKPKEIASAPHFTHCQPASIELDGVAWSPHRNKPLLKPITVSLQPGEFLVVVGPNGSGKTSLLRCLYRINKPTQGKVLMDGKDIWSLSPRQCAQRIATVLQDTGGDFGLSVFEMVEVGLTPRSLVWGRSEEDIQIVENALALLDVGHLSQRSFDSLSGGERQRVMIARALAQQPDVLILDEPTNHLDIRHQLEVLALLSTLPCTLIVSLHDLALASAYADRVLVMQNGEMQACAPPSHVFTKQRIKQVFDVETIIDEHPITQRPRFSFFIND